MHLSIYTIYVYIYNIHPLALFFILFDKRAQCNGVINPMGRDGVVLLYTTSCICSDVFLLKKPTG